MTATVMAGRRDLAMSLQNVRVPNRSPLTLTLSGGGENCHSYKSEFPQQIDRVAVLLTTTLSQSWRKMLDGPVKLVDAIRMLRAKPAVGSVAPVSLVRSAVRGFLFRSESQALDRFVDRCFLSSVLRMK